MKYRPIRLFVQIAVLLAMVIIPILNIFEIYFIKGSFYSLDIGDVSMSDPLSIFQVIITSKTFNIVMLVTVSIPILAVFFFGRVWCSWACPYYTIVEGLAFIRKKIGLISLKKEYSPSDPVKANFSRYSILLLGLIITGIFGFPFLNLFSAPGIISTQTLLLVKTGIVTVEIFLILLLLIIEFFFIDKFWCRLVCPVGTFLTLFTSKRTTLQIKKLKPECSNCSRCIRVCPMNINPMTEGENSLCFNCGDCIDACPDNKIKNKLNTTDIDDKKTLDFVFGDSNKRCK